MGGGVRIIEGHEMGGGVRNISGHEQEGGVRTYNGHETGGGVRIISGHEMEGEKTNENTQLGPTKINNVNGQSERTDAPSNRNTEGRPEGRKTFQKPKKKPDPDNITVLFVDQTPGGELAKRLQKV